jgi:hypothetical protein
VILSGPRDHAASAAILCILSARYLNAEKRASRVAHMTAVEIPTRFAQVSEARSGDVVFIIVTDHRDRRPVEDILRTDESYQSMKGRVCE